MASPVPEADSSGMQVLKIVGLVVLGLVALCGLAGTCLFVLLLASGGLGN